MFGLTVDLVVEPEVTHPVCGLHVCVSRKKSLVGRVGPLGGHDQLIS